MTSALTIDRLTFVRNQQVLLHDLQFSIVMGGITLILGPNGAGKTLLLRCLSGLLTPTEGSVLTSDSQAVHKLSRPDSARLFSWTPVSQHLPFDFSVIDLLLMGRYPLHRGFPQALDHQAVQTALDRTGIRHLKDRTYNSLSRGEQAKVDIARACAADTPLMILDEPFANLDIDACLQLVDLLHQLRREGKTLILSHHDLYSVRDLATHVVLLRKGKLVACGPTQHIFTPEAIEQTYAVVAKEVSDPESGELFVRFRLQEKAPLPNNSWHTHSLAMME